MSATVTLTCTAHPKYKAVRRPRVPCWGCQKIWDLTRPDRAFFYAGKWASLQSGRIT